MLLWSGVSQETRTPRTQAHAAPRSPWRRVAPGALVLLAIAVAGVLTYWRFFVASPATTRQPSLQTAVVAQFQFVTSDKGWVGVVQPTGGAVLATADGGRHWRPQLALPGLQPRWMHFFDAGRGFVLASASGGIGKTEQLYRTSDGGAHWAPVGLPGPSTIYSIGTLVSFAGDQSTAGISSPPTAIRRARISPSIQPAMEVPPGRRCSPPTSGTRNPTE